MPALASSMGQPDSSSKLAKLSDFAIVPTKKRLHSGIPGRTLNDPPSQKNLLKDSRPRNNANPADLLEEMVGFEQLGGDVDDLEVGSDLVFVDDLQKGFDTQLRN